jgi:hypothetical protein
MKRLLIMLAMLVSMPAWGAQTVQHLRDQCSDHANEVEHVTCLGYISGAADMMVMASNVLEFSKTNLPGNPGVIAMINSLAICAKDVSYGAMRQAFYNFATAHPEDWNHPAMDTLLAALRDKWPCR